MSAHLSPEALDVLVRAVTARPITAGVCSRCNGMGGISVPSNGGRTFIGCPRCKGIGKEPLA